MCHGLRITAGLLLLTICWFPRGSLLPAAALAQGEATVRVSAPERGSVDEEIAVDIVVDNVTDFGAFQFILTFDSDVLELASTEDGPKVLRGPFLGSSGRAVVCPEPEVQGEVLRFACVTLGMTPTGAEGGGVIATVSFRGRGAGASSLALSRVRIVHRDGGLIESTSSDALIEVRSQDDGRSVLVYVGVAAAGGVVVATAALAVLFYLGRQRTSPPRET